MPLAADRMDFGPPRDRGSVRAFALALLIHALLIVALTWGVNWKRTDVSTGFEAEIWSSVPQQAAPRLIEPTPPPPTPAQAPVPPVPVAVAPEPKAQAPAPDVDIALEQDKKRKQLEKQKEADAKKQLDKQKAVLAQKEKDLKDKADKARQLAAAEDAKKLEAQKLAKQNNDKQVAAAAEKQRQENLSRMAGLAGASGGPTDTGKSLRFSGPSPSYGGMLRAAIRPNIVFSKDIVGNPIAVVEVRVMSDGTVISQKLTKSSGDPDWDEAAIKAIIRTRTLPRDVDGRMPDNILIIEMRASEQR